MSMLSDVRSKYFRQQLTREFADSFIKRKGWLTVAALVITCCAAASVGQLRFGARADFQQLVSWSLILSAGSVTSVLLGSAITAVVWHHRNASKHPLTIADAFAHKATTFFRAWAFALLLVIYAVACAWLQGDFYKSLLGMVSTGASLISLSTSLYYKLVGN